MNPDPGCKTIVPSVRRLNLSTAAIAGVIAGPATFGAVFFVGPMLTLGFGVLAGIIISATAARASNGYEFRAGFITSAFAVASVFVTSILRSLLFEGGTIHPVSAESMLMLLFWWMIFAVPGMLGSLWIWEGRRSSETDKIPPVA